MGRRLANYHLAKVTIAFVLVAVTAISAASEPEFAAYRPQLEWLIHEKQWAGLLDRFYQILPFGTGGRRGAVGIGPNRMNNWTLGANWYILTHFRLQANYVLAHVESPKFNAGKSFDPKIFELRAQVYF